MNQSSEIIIGCMTWGKWGRKWSIKEAAEYLSFCCDQGNTTFDHADIYGDYTTEADFGKALIESGIDRDHITLLSKCGIQLLGNRHNRVKHYEYGTTYILNSVEQTLKNLKTDYLDMLLLHRPSPLMIPEEISEAIHQLKEQGKIKAFGVSNFTATQMDLLSSYVKVECNQFEFSLTHHDAMENGDLDYMRKVNMKTLCWSPLGSYFKNNDAKKIRIQHVIDDLCEKYDTSEDTLLLAWILRHPAQLSPVVGTTQKDRLIRSNHALNIQLDLQDWFIMLEASKGKEVA